MDNDYEKIGFKCGIEIHNRLATRAKLFCECPARFSNSEPTLTIMRKLRPVAGELGKIDAAAAHEYLRDKTFRYQIFRDTTCLVEIDEEPPHELNPEALEICLQVAKLLRAEIPEEIHVMRKTVIDGSNTAGFQRTALVGTNGILETSLGPVRIENISVEEESAGIVEKGEGFSVFRLDRLGIPLVEIGTAADIKSPEHAAEVAEKLGALVRSTGKSQRGLGSIRQDVNVSISGGARVEIKGFQALEEISKIIHGEIERQRSIVASGGRVEKEVRAARQDGTTEFMRPLPGGARMYPETDIPPIVITKEFLAKIKLPESWESRLERLKKVLPSELAEQILRSEHYQLYEKYSKSVEPVVVANIFSSTLKDLRRRGAAVENLTDAHFEEIFKLLAEKKISKEAVPGILEKLCNEPAKKVSEISESFGAAMTEEELRKIVRMAFVAWPELVKEKKFSALMGEVMKQVRGRIDGAVVKRVVEEEMGK
ncbi:MAG TPA: Glu-tRNA(Gln) amidotransferase subunit GatE [archaeon]|nr:Glu-tRNA(Gln) amidotransferase subunit GatE [archaeon]